MSDERRRFFRIEDVIGLSYELMTPHKHKKKEEAEKQDVLDVLAQFDRDIDVLTEQLQKENPKWAKLALLLNQKIDRLAVKLVPSTSIVRRTPHASQRVNVSACGIAFVTDEYIEPEEKLKLLITLPGNDRKLNLIGEVIGCDEIALSKKYRCRVNYINVAPATQEILIQHIVKRQAQLLAKQKAK